MLIESQEEPYLMSFSTGGLFINESVVVARLHKPSEKWDETAISAVVKGVFPVRKVSSARRSIREIVNRLKYLTVAELELLLDGSRGEQLSLLWLATCRAYRFVREFSVEVIREKYLSFNTQLTYDDFDSFWGCPR